MRGGPNSRPHRASLLGLLQHFGKGRGASGREPQGQGPEVLCGLCNRRHPRRQACVGLHVLREVQASARKGSHGRYARTPASRVWRRTFRGILTEHTIHQLAAVKRQAPPARFRNVRRGGSQGKTLDANGQPLSQRRPLGARRA